MKKFIYTVAALLIGATTLVSCEKELITYEGKPDIYFANGAALVGADDSTLITFAFAKSLDTVRSVTVSLVGKPVDYDREYKLQINEQSTAIEGTHFEALPKTFVLKKNTMSDVVKIKFLRTPDMMINGVALVLDLVPNENFATNMKSRVVSGKKVSTIRTKIEVNDIIRKPKAWLDGAFGAFTRKKMMLMCPELNIEPMYLETGVSVPECYIFGKAFQRYLNDEKLAGRTVYEDDGTEMRMGAASQ